MISLFFLEKFPLPVWGRIVAIQAVFSVSIDLINKENPEKLCN
jgi:hypothetical protein